MILSMHARMAECVHTQDESGVEEARKPVPMPAASLGNCRSAGLRTLELKRLGGISAHRLPELCGSVAVDALGFDYRCGGSAGITVLAAHQLPVTFRRGAL